MLIDANSGNRCDLAEGHTPRWSPVNREIAILQGQPSQVWIYPLGGVERQITHFPQGVSEYTWSEDGRQIAVVTSSEETPSGPESDPKPKSIIEVHHRSLTAGHVLWVVEVSTGESRQIARSSPGVFWSSPAWSPDGERIALMESVALATDLEAQFHLAIVELKSGSSYDPLGRTERFVGSPQWSPDGTRLALPYSPHDYAYPFRTVCGVLQASDGEVKEYATSHFHWFYNAPQWHPDNSTLFFLGNRGITRQIMRVDTAGAGEFHPLTSDLGVYDHLRLSRDGKWLVCTYRTPISRQEIVLLSTDGLTRRSLAQADPFFSFELSDVELVRWKAPDGLELEGQLVKPLDFQLGRRYPMIVDLHGGPVGYLFAELHTHLHYLAAHGYLVFAPDFRSSQSYGWYPPPQYMENDFEDVMAGVDRMIEQGHADPDRLGVRGHSYGANLTARIIGHAHRFKAAIPASGAYEEAVAYAMSRVGGNRFIEEIMGGKPWEVPEVYRRYSPLTYAHQTQTPTLILQGDDPDERAQAALLYTWLLQAGVKVEYIQYEGEGHVLSKREHKEDFWNRTIAWFDEHLTAVRVEPFSDR